MKMITNDARRRRQAKTSSALARYAERRLRESGYPWLAKIACTSRSGVVSLHGQLPTYYAKQVAQTIVAQIDGVARVDNCTTVKLDGPSGRFSRENAAARLPTVTQG